MYRARPPHPVGSPARLPQAKVYLVQYHRLIELQEYQRKLAGYVGGYVQARGHIDGCRKVRSKLEEGMREPDRLSSYGYWEEVREELEGVPPFAAELATMEPGLGEKLHSFDTALGGAKEQIRDLARRCGRLEEEALLAALDSVLGFVNTMVDLLPSIVEECKKQTDVVLGQIEACIRHIFEQPLSAEEARATVKGASRRGEQERLRFRVQLGPLTGRTVWVRASAGPVGEYRGKVELPYTSAELNLVLELLEKGARGFDSLADAEREALQRLDLLEGGRPGPHLLSRIGGRVYQTLFPGGVGVAFKEVYNQARRRKAAVALQIRFDEDAVSLARYPWELLYVGQGAGQGSHPVATGTVEITRYITYGGPKLEDEGGQLPYRLLFVAPRPSQLSPLPGGREESAVRDALRPLIEAGYLVVESPERPTYQALQDELDRGCHVIHFDGHGVFGRWCRGCGELHPAHVTVCSRCGMALGEPCGYLAFEDEAGGVDYVGPESMRNLLERTHVRLVFLSACESAEVQGSSVFHGLGPGLIQAGIPAVVAMQISLPAVSAREFARGFYTALAEGERVSCAVARGRWRLSHSDYWFVPALYLRSTDDRGPVIFADVGKE